MKEILETVYPNPMKSQDTASQELMIARERVFWCAFLPFLKIFALISLYPRESGENDECNETESLYLRRKFNYLMSDKFNHTFSSL